LIAIISWSTQSGRPPAHCTISRSAPVAAMSAAIDWKTRARSGRVPRL